MVWFKTDDSFYSHPKVVSIPRTIRPAALGTWLLAGTWSADHLTDGIIPFHQIEELGASVDGAFALVKAKLWTKTKTEFRFKSWAEYQPTRAEVEEAREAERVRKASQRAAQKARRDTHIVPVGSPGVVPPVSHWDNPGTPSGQTRVSGHPDPTRPDPTALPSEGGRASATAPSPFCPIHPTGSTTPCRACGNARRAFDAWTPPAAEPRTVKHIPGLCDDHRQPEASCEMCERENAHASRILVGRFGGAA